jgi:hypothetical protein
MGVERFLADSQLVREIVHRHTAEPMTEKVCPRRAYYPLSNRIVPSVLPLRRRILVHNHLGNYYSIFSFQPQECSKSAAGRKGGPTMQSFPRNIK